MEFMKIVLCTILIIGMIIAAVYGVIEVVDLVIDLGKGTVNTVENVVDNNNPEEGNPNLAATVEPAKLTIWEEHCRGLVLSASALAVMFIGWTQVLEYFKD